MALSTAKASGLDIDRKVYHGVDLFKFICAFLVVSIHAPPLTSHEIPHLFLSYFLSRIAVPFFFIASGFFLFRKMSPEHPDVHLVFSAAKKFYFLYAVWTAVYLPHIIYDIFTYHRGPFLGLLLFVRSAVFAGSYTQLWYLNASGFALLLLGVLLYKKVSIKTICILSVLFYAVGLLGQSYYGLIEPLMDAGAAGLLLRGFFFVCTTTRNGPFFAFPLMVVGMLLAYRPVRLKTKTAALLLALSMLLLLLEVNLVFRLGLAQDYNISVFLVPAAFFLLCFSTSLQLKERPVYRYLRSMSSLIFYVHTFFIPFIDALFASRMVENKPLRFLLVAGLSVITSQCIILLSRVNRFSLIKKLYA